MKRLRQHNAVKPRCEKGRGAVSNPPKRYAIHRKEAYDDGWGSLEVEGTQLDTSLAVDKSRTVNAYNNSPDVPFDRSIDPYRGCEHGCIYCSARTTHAWLGHSPGLEFESRIYHKPDASACLRRELAAPRYACAPIAIGGITDAYQPVEQRLKLTRQILELLKSCGHPLTIVTKSALVERDLELLQEMARLNQAQVQISFATLSRDLARRLETRAAAPQRRTAPLFSEWLETHVPDQARRVLNRIRDTRDGCLYRSAFRNRMRGTGSYADLIAQRFRLAQKRLGFEGIGDLDCSGFVKPQEKGPQMKLF